MWRPYFTQLLKDSIRDSKQRNAAVSLRRYAQRIGVSAGYLSEVLSGKRKISDGRALFIAEKANFPDSAVRRLRSLISKGDGQTARVELSGSDVLLLANVDYFRLAAAFEVLPFPCRVEDIIALLDIGSEKLTSLLAMLERIGIVERTKDLLYWSPRHFTTTNDVPSEAIREFHKATLQSNIRALEKSVSEREFTTVIFGGTSSKLPDAKKVLRNFRDIVVESMASENDDCVYQLSIQLVPVSNMRKDTRQ